MLRFEKYIRVSYKDTDCMGFVHHSNYLVYFETARTEMFRSLGLEYSAMEKNEIISPIISAELRYLRPASYDEVLRVVVTLDSISPVRLGLRYEVYDERDNLINTGKTVSAFLNRRTHRPVHVPEQIVNIANNEN